MVGVDTEPFVLSYACKLNILAVQLLLHDLLQRLEDEDLSFRQSERLVELILQLCLCAFRSGSDRLGVVAVERAGRLSVVPSVGQPVFLIAVGSCL